MLPLGVVTGAANEVVVSDIARETNSEISFFGRRTLLLIINFFADCYIPWFACPTTSQSGLASVSCGAFPPQDEGETAAPSRIPLGMASPEISSTEQAKV